MQVDRIAVIGAGVMGHGIAQVAAASGFQVRLNEVSGDLLAAGMDRIRWSVGRLVERGKLPDAEAAELLGRIRPTSDLAEAVRDADLVIEAVTENLDVKRQLMAAVDAAAPDQAVLASNTSQYSITQLGSFTKNPSRVCGMHFFNPPVLMRLVEIARGLATSDAAYETVAAVSRRMGKEVVTCKDSQGFITSRLIMALAVEALRIVEEGVATPEDVDKGCRLGLGHAMGPLETIDWSGLDTALFVSQELRGAFGEHFRAPQTLRNLVRNGDLGRKSGRGVYKYDADGKKVDAGKE